jgi:acetyl-CoA carboxylase carboxyltransferase component
MDNINELNKRIETSKNLGGKENIEKQHKKNKMTVYERINKLVDKDTFQERGVLAGIYENDKFYPCPFRMGIATINGKHVAVSGDDFTVKGASVGRLYKAKAAYFIKMARAFKIPAIRLVEGAGGSIKEILNIGYTELPSSGDECTQNRVDALSEIPVVSACFGSAAGLAALHMVLSHFSVMVKNSHIFVGGPPLVKAAFGKEYSKDELGGYKIHTELTGVIDNVANDEIDALEQIKTFLSYMPSNVWELPPMHNSNDSEDRIEEELSYIIPENQRKPYNIRKILNLIFDKNSIFEIGKNFAKSQVTALATLNGFPVGILANDTNYLAGAFNYDSAEKFQRFVDLCDTFHIPIVNLVDQPGLMIGKDSEIHGTIRRAARASCAIVQAKVPIAVVYIRKCFGVGGAIQKGGNNLSWRVAWPTAKWGNIPVEGGVYAAHRREIENSPNPDKLLKELEEKYKEIISPFKTAEAFGIEDIIDPKYTRPFLCKWIKLAYNVEKNNLGIKKRGMRC